MIEQTLGRETAVILACQTETEPDVILIEGQSSLRNPSGPSGSELILAGSAKGVILQHAPARLHFDELEELDCRIPPIEEEIAIRIDANQGCSLDKARRLGSLAGDFARDPARGGFVVEEGCLRLLDRPGLGVDFMD